MGIHQALFGSYISEVNLMRWLYSKDDLKTSKSKNRRRWLQIITAGLTYILANLIDYRLTMYGAANTNYREANPIALGYMSVFGMAEGLMIYKMLMVSAIISAVIMVDIFYRRKNIRFRSEYLLYAGAIMTTLGGSLWLIQF